MSSAAQQVLCACITADMRSPNTCCASGYQLVGDIFFLYNLPNLRQAFRRICNLPNLRQAFRRICNPSLKNDLTYLCSADLQSAAGRL